MTTPAWRGTAEIPAAVAAPFLVEPGTWEPQPVSFLRRVRLIPTLVGAGLMTARVVVASGDLALAPLTFLAGAAVLGAGNFLSTSGPVKRWGMRASATQLRRGVERRDRSDPTRSRLRGAPASWNVARIAQASRNIRLLDFYNPALYGRHSGTLPRLVHYSDGTVISTSGKSIGGVKMRPTMVATRQSAQRYSAFLN